MMSMQHKGMPRHLYSNYFRSNINNNKKVWKQIKSIVSCQIKGSDTRFHSMREFLTNPKDTVNNFNNFQLLPPKNHS